MGFRVLGVGHRKVIPKEQLGTSVLASTSKAIQILAQYDRKDFESNLIFDGFEIFENRLKPATKTAIKQIKKANIPCVMITGDNPLTAANIGY